MGPLEGKPPQAKLPKYLRRKSAPIVQQDPVIPEESKSVSGFIEKQAGHVKDILWGIAKTTFYTAPKEAIEFAKLYKDWHYLLDRPDLAASEVKKTAKAVWDVTKEPWERAIVKGDIGGALYESAVPMTLDALSLITLGGGAAVKGGRLMGGLSKAERAAKGIETVSKASRLVDWGTAAKDLPTKINRAIIEQPQRLFGIDPKVRASLKAVERNKATQGNLIKQAAQERLTPLVKPLNNDMRLQLQNQLIEGSSPALDAQYPQVAAVRKQYGDFIRQIRESRVKERHLLSDEELLKATAKKRAAYTGETPQVALERIKALPEEYRPVYLPFEEEIKRGALEIFTEGLKVTPPMRKGAVSWLERYKGGKTTLPVEKAMMRAIHSFVDVEMRLQFMEELAQKGHVVPYRKGLSRVDDLMPVGDAIHKRYFRDRARAGAAGVGNIITTEGAQNAERLLLSDPATAKYIKSIAGLAASDPTVASYLKWTFYKAPEPFAKFIRLYDKVINLFKKSATVWNPRYYTGNIVSDAVLMAMANEFGLHHGLAKRLLKDLPSAVGLGAKAVSHDVGGLSSRLTRLSDLYESADLMARTNIATGEMVRQFKLTAGSFTAAEQTLDDFVRKTSGSQAELSDIRFKVQMLQEGIARRVPMVAKLDQQIPALERLLAREQASVVKGVSNREATGAYREAMGFRGEYGREAQKLMGQRKAIIKALKDIDLTVMQRLTRRTLTKLRAKGLQTPAISKLQADIGMAQRAYVKAVEELAEVRVHAQIFLEGKRASLPARILERGGLKPSVELPTGFPSWLKKKDALNTADVLAEDFGFTDSQAFVQAIERDVAQFFKKSPRGLLRKAKENQKLAQDKLAETLGYKKSDKALKFMEKVKRQTSRQLESKLGELTRGVEGSIREGRLYKDLAKSEMEKLKGRPRTSETTDKIQVALQQKRALREALIGEARQQIVDSGELHAKIPELQKYADIAELAVQRANAFMGDYWGMGPIERAVFKRIVPFYAWTKAMSMLAFQYPFLMPKSALFWHRYSKTMLEMVGDDELPEWMAPYVPVAVAENGDTVWLKMEGLSPFGGVRMGTVGEAPIPSILQFWKHNPIVRLGYRLVGGRDEFYWAGRPTDGTVVVEVGDGTVSKVVNGKIETVIPQAPLLRSVAYMFPHVQMLHQLISDYDVNRGPLLNPDGSIKYPKELWQRVLETVGPRVKVANREKLIDQEKAVERGFMMDLKKMYRRAGPQEREYIKGVFEDRARRGRYRLKAAQ